MSFHSNTRLTNENEEDRMEKAEEDDAEAEEKAERELAGKYADLTSNEGSVEDEYDEGTWGRWWCHFKHVAKVRFFTFLAFLRTDVYRGFRSVFLLSGFTLINRGTVRSHTSLIHERFRQTSAYPFIIHPFSLFRWIWDIGIVLDCAIMLLVDPVRSAFYAGEYYRKYDQWREPFKQNTFLFLDVLLNFRTGLVQNKTDIVTLDGLKILKSYVKSWFLIDLVSSFPVNGLYLALVHNNHLDAEDKGANDGARILVVIKFLLIFRLIRYLKRVELGLRLNGLEIRLLNLLVVMLIFLHWIACAHFFIPDLANEELESRKKSNSWLTKRHLWSMGAYERYLNCFLRALSHFSLIGFAFHSPVETEEIYLSIANIMIGICFMAQMLGYVITMLMSVDVAERKYIEVKKQAGEYMRFKQIPKSLQNRVEVYYQQRYRHNYHNEESILASVSHALRREIQMHNCAGLVEEVPLFHNLNRNVLQEIVARLEFEVFLPNDVIIWANSIGDNMYFIEHGTVSILTSEGRLICTLHDGDFFGEMSMVFNERRISTVIAASYCDIYRLDKLDFVEVIEPYPQIYEHIVKIAEARAKRLDKNYLYKSVKVVTDDKEEEKSKNR